MEGPIVSDEGLLSVQFLGSQNITGGYQAELERSLPEDQATRIMLMI